MARIIRKLELAKVGKWGANSDEITAQDLKDAVETFTANRPVAIGHEAGRRDDAPKFGAVWSLGLEDAGNTLVGDVEFSQELDSLYKAGKYDGWSVSLPKRKKDGKAYFHHLAFLGATPPKIPELKDLGAVSFNYADGDEVVLHEFSGAIKNFDDDILTKEDVEMTDEEIKKMQEDLAAAKAEIEKLKAEKEKLEAEKKALEDASNKGGEKEPEVPKEFSDKLNKYEEELRKSKLSAFEAQIASCVPAGVKGVALGLASSLAGRSDAVEFADNGKNGNATELELLGKILSAWPEAVKVGSSGFDFSDTEKPVDWAETAMKM